MGKKKNKPEKVMVEMAEYKVPMHCNACERVVAKAISKMKGVDKFMTDMTNQRVVITGMFDQHKVRKKLKKKTGKRVELVVQEEDKDGEEEEREDDDGDAEEDDSEIHMMFNDENANACSIM